MYWALAIFASVVVSYFPIGLPLQSRTNKTLCVPPPYLKKIIASSCLQVISRIFALT